MDDFIGPSAFYRALLYRNQLNPVGLKRSNKRIQQKSSRNIEICFQNLKLTTKATGRVIISSVMLRFSDKLNITVENTVEYKMKRGEKFPNKLIPIQTTTSTKYDQIAPNKLQIVIIVFVSEPSSYYSKDSSNITESILNSSILNSSSFRCDNSIVFSILEINYESAIKFDSRSTVYYQEHQANENSLSAFRKYLIPLYMRIQTIPLYSKLQPTFSSIPVVTNAKSEILIDCLVIQKYAQSKLSSSLDSSHSISSSALNPSVFFHYLLPEDCRDTGSMVDESNSVVECLKTLTCPWCVPKSSSSHSSKFVALCSDGELGWHQSTTKNTLSLLSHLNAYHFHFSYEAIQDQLMNLHIIVRRDKSHDLDATDILEERVRPYFYFRHFRPQHEVTLTSFKIPKIIIPLHNLTSWKSGKQASAGKVKRVAETKKAHHRQYFHARIGLPLTESEFLNTDSDDEIDMSWEKSAGNRGLCEFEDICQEEKLLMTMWNAHIGACPPYSNAYVPMVTELFVRKFAAEILMKGLRHNLLLHLLNLADFNLLRIEDVHALVCFVDIVQSNNCSSV